MAMAAAKIAVRIKGQATCLHHKGRQLELYCETCQELACLKCVTGIHKGHLLCDLSVITNQKEEDIINFIDRTEQNELVQNRKEIASIDVLLQGNERTFEKLSTQLRMQTEELKQDLDKLTVETLSLYKKMKEDNVKIIQKYKQDLEMYGRQLKEQIHECLTALEQGSQIEIYDTECEIDSQIHHPVGPVLNSVIFTPNKKPRNYLELAVGNVATCHGRLSTEQEPLAKCTISDDQQRSSTAQEPDGNGGKVVTRIKLPTHAKVVEDWESPCDIWSICPTTDGQAWTSNYSETLTLLDRWKGTVMQEVTHTDGIKDISMSPTTFRL
ncbi:transcription intermediary factor 1-alpha-like [Argopecten irradians]|uniref:transcription intermediary factor 1-alpha-like n=1 Tax=Argopecten irradians TaxID=31199 RepID=UPI003723BBFE